MNTKNKNSKRRTYCVPFIERILLDNEISLILQSDGSPDGEPLGVLENFNYDPFKTNLG